MSFTDPNHKPEFALALTEFEAFCGFKLLDAIDRLMKLRLLQVFLPQVKKPESDDQTLKYIVKRMLEASDEVIRKTNDALMQLPKEAFGEDGYIPEMIPRLSKQYDKTDPGIVVALIMTNCLRLQPGQSIHIPANGTQVYLYDDTIECMARSNNVLNTRSLLRTAIRLTCSARDLHSRLITQRKPFCYRKNSRGVKMERRNCTCCQ